MTQMTDPAGNIYTYTYDTSNRLSSVTYPGTSPVNPTISPQRLYLYENATFPAALTGIIDENNVRFATFAYDTTGRGISSEHAGGIDKHQLTYNADGTTTVTDPLGTKRPFSYQNILGIMKATGLNQPAGSGAAAASSSWNYDTNGNISSRTDYNGITTTYTYDQTRNLETSRTEASGAPLARTITTVWHPTFRLPTQINEPNRVTTLTYDASGNLTQRNITAGTLSRTWQYQYNITGLLTQAKGPRTDVNAVTSFAYDAQGNLASITDALGHVTTISAYDAAGRPLTMTDPNGLVTQLTYDPRGRLLSRSVGTEVTSYTYDGVGQLLKTTLPDGSFTSYTYDPAHRLTGVTDNLGNSITYTLDAVGNSTKEETHDPANVLARTLSRQFDALSRLAALLGAQNQTTSFRYDANGNLTGIIDPLANSTSRSFDALNRLLVSTDPAGGTVKLAYDPNDNLTSVTDPLNHPTLYGYDGLGNRTQTISPDTGTSQNTFDAAGNLLSTTDAAGRVATYTYDALNRITQANFTGTTAITFTYDQGTNGIGHLTQMTNGPITNWKFDNHGRITLKSQQTGAVSLTTGYAYDAAGRLTAVTYPSGKVVNLTYTAGQLSGLTLGGTPLISGIHYQPFGPPDGWTWGSGTSYSRTFDLDGRMTKYDLGDRTRDLTYDAAGRIIIATDTGGAVIDPILAILSQTLTYATDSNRLLSVTETGTRNLTYDGSGNTVADGTAQYTYDGRGRLVQVVTAAGNFQYTLNGLGQRVAKSGGASPTARYYAYDEAGHLIGEYDASGAVIQETVWLGAAPLAVLKPNAATASTDIFYVYSDHLGTPRTITKTTGTVVWQWQSDAFGTIPANEDPGSTGSKFTYNLRFPGQYYDLETGLHYNYFRDYNPGTGRYVQSDPIGLSGGVNSYFYVRGNPIDRIDAIGLRDVVVAVWDAYFTLYPKFTNSVGHVFVGEMDGTTILSQFPYEHGIYGYNSKKTWSETLALEGKVPDAVFIVRINDDAAFDEVVRQEKNKEFWSIFGTNNSTNCAISSSSALLAGKATSLQDGGNIIITTPTLVKELLNYDNARGKNKKYPSVPWVLEGLNGA
jgi:RHS repeat-associated protein